MSTDHSHTILYKLFPERVPDNRVVQRSIKQDEDVLVDICLQITTSPDVVSAAVRRALSQVGGGGAVASIFREILIHEPWKDREKGDLL